MLGHIPDAFSLSFRPSLLGSDDLPLPIPLHLSLVERFMGHLGLSGESIALPGGGGGWVGMASCNGCSPVLATQVMDE